MTRGARAPGRGFKASSVRARMIGWAPRSVPVGNAVCICHVIRVSGFVAEPTLNRHRWTDTESKFYLFSSLYILSWRLSMQEEREMLPPPHRYKKSASIDLGTMTDAEHMQRLLLYKKSERRHSAHLEHINSQLPPSASCPLGVVETTS